MFKKILVAADGSSRGEKAASYAIDLAKICNAELVIVCVVDAGSPRSAMEIDPDSIKELGDDYDTSDLEKEREKVESQIVNHLNDKAKQEGIQSSGVVRAGNPSEEILKQAQEADSDLIVMGSHGRSGLAAAVMGSVSTKVVHAGALPVLIVPA